MRCAQSVKRNLVAGLFLALATQPAASESIPLEQVGAVYMVPVRINDAVTIPFIVDSGASDVVIPADVFSTLLRTGTVTRADFKGTAKATLADGSTMSSERYVLHKMVVGTRVITDVVASVSPAKSEPLLGQSFLSKLPDWKIDNAQHALVVGGAAGPAAASPAPPRTAPRDGHGVLTYADGARYVGEIRNGRANGNGVMTYANGLGRFEGEWRNGEQNGHGVATLANGYRLEGQWSNGKLNGYAVETRPNGFRFEGQWRNSEPNGRGVMAFSNGLRGEGEWRNRPRHPEPTHPT